MTQFVAVCLKVVPGWLKPEGKECVDITIVCVHGPFEVIEAVDAHIDQQPMGPNLEWSIVELTK